MELSGTSNLQKDDSETRQPGESRITPELVKEVADMIYSMFLHDLKIEDERLGLTKPQNRSKFGGKS